MSRLTRPLYLAYGALLVWLTYCAITSAHNGSPWACTAFAAGAAIAITAAIREGDLEDALHREAVLAQRRERPHPSERLDTAIDAAIDAAGAHAVSRACCERWWTSLATDHDPTCPNQQRSAA